MPATVSRFQDGPDRKRRAHAKSRKGCGNCKLRRVKCDEARPHCKKCLSYGVSCNYDGKQASLDLSAQGVFQVDFSEKQEEPKTLYSTALTPRLPPMSVSQSMIGMLNDGLEPESFPPTLPFCHYTMKDLEVFQRFETRTVMTVGTARGAPHYRSFIGPMAFNHPFLMHMILSLTLMHDAHLASPDVFESSRHQHASLKHWNTATILFNRVLSRPIQPDSRDALWATAALIGCNVFAYVEAPDFEQAWPLKPSDPNDLDWIKLSEGKKAIWKLAEPYRPDSRFNVVATEQNHSVVPQWVEENNIEAIAPDARRLFNIDHASTVKTNPYHLPALILSNLQFVPPTHDNVLNFLYFLGYMTPEYRNLLEIKDPRALLLLGWWFKRLENSQMWWLTRRAAVEGGAIQIWLERWYGGEVGLKNMFELLGQTSPRCDEGVNFPAWSQPQTVDIPECQVQ